MSHLPAAAFIKDTTGRTLYANKYLQELLNFHEWEGKTTLELVSGEEGQEMLEDDRRALAQGQIEIQETMTVAQGDRRTFETIKFPIPCKGKPTLLGGISIDITKRLALEREVLHVSEREQHRIGEDLHDGLGQSLTAIELLCSSLKNDLPDRPELRDQATRMGQLLREAIRQTRLLAHGLIGFRLTSHGLSAALTELAQNVTSLGRVPCRFDGPAPVSFHDSAIAGHFYRIAQEAVHNAVKHAQASQLMIHLAEQAGALRLMVSDDGQGLPHPDAWNRGMGLQLMQHRANAIGAKLTVESKPGQGVTVTCAWRRKESKASAHAGDCPP